MTHPRRRRITWSLGISDRASVSKCTCSSWCHLVVTESDLWREFDLMLDMSLSKLNISSSASTLRGTRDGFVGRTLGKASNRPESVQVRGAVTGESGAGELESKVAKLGGYVEKKPHGRGNDVGGEIVHYNGTAVIIKKLQFFDVVDRIADVQDDFCELLGGKHVSVQLISNDINPRTGKALVSREVELEGWVTILDPLTVQELSFHLDFAVPKAFGVPGAIIVRNNHPNEFLLQSFSLDLPDRSSAHFITNSWVYNTEHTEGPRVFFRNKAYLPTDTPAALKELREKELQTLRGDGKGERKFGERIYDYDVYNDLGLPDDGPQHARPILGGNSEFPFPRRMRTGRPPTLTNPKCESRKSRPFYVPSDERFDYLKLSDNKADLVRAGGHAISSKIQAKLMKKADFDSIEEVWKLYAPKGKDVGGINNVLPGKVDVEKHDQYPLAFLQELTARRADGENNHPLRFPVPQVVQANITAWQTDEEFAREFLAGFNPITIKLVTEFPLKSSLDPAVYGDPTSAISSKHIDGHLEGLSVQEALSKKKLFVVDYHDIFFPWVGRINALENSKTYASRTLFFLSSDETLKVLAIELVLPPKSLGEVKIARVFTPPADSSIMDYVWQLAKAHTTNNEMAVHQSLNHFTRCHAVTEPIIIASHRQLSKMHPIHQLMAPHMKHTLEVNSTARMNLLPAGGTIEEIYTPRQYIVRMAAAEYRDNWTFSSNALPNDLIKRGMAVPDSSAKHGVRLVVEDYPYAADGLEHWSALKSWNTEYIDIFYKDDGAVQNDAELQRWWTEYRTVGHADKKDAPGWLELDSKTSLAEILTTLQWICTVMHAPINFGQFDYAGFMPKNPAITRRLIPEEGSTEWQELQRNPEKFFLSSISDTDTTTTAMAVFEVVAAHAPNEEYIGQRSSTWTENEKAKAAFKRYADRLSDIDELIQARNRDKSLKNRCGVAQIPFQLLRPTSAPGVTGMGVPNSITV